MGLRVASVGSEGQPSVRAGLNLGKKSLGREPEWGSGFFRLSVWPIVGQPNTVGWTKLLRGGGVR